MDIHDESNSNSYVPVMEAIIAGLQKQSSRAGQTVSNFEPREVVLVNFSLRRLSRTMAISSGRELLITTVTPPYAPCATPLNDLEPITISAMKLETHHRGKKTILRVISPTDRTPAVVAIVEDEKGTAVKLVLSFQPGEHAVPTDDILKRGDFCILKDPYFHSTANGSYSLRVDHIGDLVWLDEHDTRIPTEWKKLPGSDTSAEKLVECANDSCDLELWTQAERQYSYALQLADTPELRLRIHLNRSLVNLRLGREEKAYKDAVLGTDAVSPTDKQLFRQFRALYQMRDFDRCLPVVQKLTDSYPDNNVFQTQMRQVTSRLRERDEGRYSFRAMYKQAENTPPLVDCATYCAPVEVRESPGRGLGLFTKVPVRAGDLLLCEKAFAYVFPHEKDALAKTSLLINVVTKRIVEGSSAELMANVIQRLYHSPETSREFTLLHHGDYSSSCGNLEVDGRPVVDSYLVEKIISLNAFGSPRTSFHEIPTARRFGNLSLALQSGYDSAGIWTKAARINHSCVGNCSRSFIGDMMIVRAARDLPADTELLFPYRLPIMMESYAETQTFFRHWGFECDCQLCTQRRLETDQALLRRHELNVRLSEIYTESLTPPLARLRQHVNRFEATFSNAGPNSIRLEMWGPYYLQHIRAMIDKRPSESIVSLIRGLKALGYEIIAFPAVGTRARPRFEVRKWGMAMSVITPAFMHLYTAYMVVAPELLPVVKEYTEIAYRIAVGESVTVRDSFPDLL